MKETPNFDFEKLLYEKGYKLIAGVDEAGRGPLAGDVFAAAVILPAEFDPKEINDSKKLTEKKREELFEYIIKNCLAYGIGKASAKEIDRINIRNAAFLAMKRAVKKLPIVPEYLLIDGNGFNDIGISYQTVIKGDSKDIFIAAASILAKVSRDRAMIKLDKKYPQYGFAKHKGYPTKEHYAAIEKFGILSEHRKSFRLY